MEGATKKSSKNNNYPKNGPNDQNNVTTQENGESERSLFSRILNFLWCCKTVSSSKNQPNNKQELINETTDAPNEANYEITKAKDFKDATKYQPNNMQELINETTDNAANEANSEIMKARDSKDILDENVLNNSKAPAKIDQGNILPEHFSCELKTPTKKGISLTQIKNVETKIKQLQKQVNEFKDSEKNPKYILDEITGCQLQLDKIEIHDDMEIRQKRKTNYDVLNQLKNKVEELKMSKRSKEQESNINNEESIDPKVFAEKDQGNLVPEDNSYETKTPTRKEKSLIRIKHVESKIQELQKQVNEIKDSEKDPKYILDDITGCQLQLDNIDINGDMEIRQKRKTNYDALIQLKKQVEEQKMPKKSRD